jgi:hypothetical protein
MPNGSYIVFGTMSRKMGFFHPLPDGITEAELTLFWDIPKAEYTVEHTIKIKFVLTDKGFIYSMDVPVFARGFGEENSAPAEFRVSSLHTCINRDHIREARWEINQTEFENGQLDEGYYTAITETITLPSAGPEHFTFHEFENMTLLRDVKQQTSFNNFVAEHDANAAVHATDFAPLVNAIRLAQGVPYKGSDYKDNWEAHPAVRELCGWWNETGPVECRKAGTFWLWVRVADEDEYWSGYHESPSVPITQFWGKTSNARFGDNVIVVFCESREACQLNEHDNPELLTVAGEYYESVGMEMEEYHPAWYALESLADFPTRFPTVWKSLVRVGKSKERGRERKQGGVGPEYILHGTTPVAVVAAPSYGGVSFEEMADGEGGRAGSKRKVGRNEPCPCGSGSKYKKCCGQQGGIFDGRGEADAG